MRTFLAGVGEFLTHHILINGSPLPFSFLDIVVRFLLPLALYLRLLRVLSRPSRKLLVRLAVSRKGRHRIASWGRGIGRGLFVLFAVLLAASILGAEMERFLAAAFGFLNQPIYSSGNTRISLLTLLPAIPIIYAASWHSRALRTQIDRTVLSRMAMDHARRFSVSNLLRYVFLVIFALPGLQNVVANFFAGLVIFVSRPIRVGDRILVNGNEGDVVQIRLIASIINTLTNERLIIPNAQIVGNPVHIYSYEDRRIILVNSVQASCAADLEQVTSVLTQVGSVNPYRVSDRASVVLVRSFDNSGITVELRTWIQNAQDKMNAHSWTNFEIWKSFKQNVIEIPFPQLDLHMKETPH